MSFRHAVAPLALLATIGSATSDARASGGVFTLDDEATSVVREHHLVLSISDDQTSLWDDVTFNGEPSDLAWVLPVKGDAEVAVSSPYLFQLLDQATSVVAQSPYISCGCSDSECNMPLSVQQSETESVTLVESEIVGPYETVRLQSSDPDALETWLATNGYAIGPDAHDAIAQYVAEGFDFVAMRLAPGQDVSALRPYRVTMPGRVPVVPLRLLTAGTGEIARVELWVLGTSSFAPTNAPSFHVDPADLVWDWNAQTSNYDALVAAGFAATDGAGWQIEGAIEHDVDWFGLVAIQVGLYPYPYEDAEAAAAADHDALVGAFGGYPYSVRITRMRAELPRTALDRDLELGPATADIPLPIAEHDVGEPPPCPPAPPHDDDPFGATATSTAAGTATGPDGDVPELGDEPDPGASDGDEASDGPSAGGDGGCAVTVTRAGRHAPAWGLAFAALAALAARRRSGQRSS